MIMGYKERLDRAMENAKIEAEARAVSKRNKKNAKDLRAGGVISNVGQRTTGGLACPKCGGTQFKAKRSAKGKAIGAVAGVAGAMLAPKSRVRCVTCKTEYVRG